MLMMHRMPNFVIYFTKCGTKISANLSPIIRSHCLPNYARDPSYIKEIIWGASARVNPDPLVIKQFQSENYRRKSAPTALVEPLTPTTNSEDKTTAGFENPPTTKEATPAMPINLSGPDISQAEIDAVADVLRSGRLSLGPKIDEFEAAVAQYVGTKHAIAVSSGTCGLHLLIRAIGLEPGDEVISTPFSFIASTNCIMFEKAKPVLVDIDPRTWNIDQQHLTAVTTGATRAIIPVDAFGEVAQMDLIEDVARQKGLRVIEDSCEALGAKYKGRMAGSFGDAGVFGFYPNKQITTGEGGMITTNDDQIDRLCRSMRNQGRDTGMGWLSHERLGYNYRMSDISAAIGVEQMKRIDAILGRRDAVAQMYIERLKDESRIEWQHNADDCDRSWFVFVVKLTDDYTEQQRNNLIANLRERGIGCSNYFAPIHLQPFYKEAFGYKEGDFPICERVAARTIALPFHNALTEAEVDEVCGTLKSLL